MKKTFVDGIALGVFLTLLGLFSLALCFEVTLFGDKTSDYIETIVISAITMAAAYLALRGIRDQIQQNYEIDENRRLSSLRAARASLPLALSEIVDHTSTALKASFDGSSTNSSDVIRSISNPFTLETLQKCIEYSDSASADRIAQIIRYIQLIQARYEPSYFNKTYPEYERDILKFTLTTRATL